MRYTVTERPHADGHMVVLLKSGRTIRIDQHHHRPTRGDRLAMALLFGGLVAALLIFAFIRVGVPLIRHTMGV